MSGMDIALSEAVLDAIYPNSGTTTVGTKTITGPTHTRVMTANGSNTAAGTELGTSAGYTAGGLATTYSAATNSGGNASKATSANPTWTNMPACTATGVETWDSGGSPQRLQWTAFAAPVTLALGDTLVIASQAGGLA